MSERLEKIKRMTEGKIYTWGISPADVRWLINRVDHMESNINEALSSLNRGGSGTRRNVKEYLEDALEGDLNE